MKRLGWISGAAVQEARLRDLGLHNKVSSAVAMAHGGTLSSQGQMG